ncbi:collagen-like protein [Pseudolysobacter antarcticus]|nr:collagen-like protein [Pseudolysobacter antarcticus]
MRVSSPAINSLCVCISVALTGAVAHAADVTVAAPTGGGFSVRDSSNSTDWLRVYNGAASIPALGSLATQTNALCFDITTGTLGPCASGSSVGPTGATGMIGAMGATGVAGAIGATGATGFGMTGAAGVTGATGVQGLVGVTGPTGVSGSGATGVTGNIGATGVTGANGFTGATGATGFGAIGATGVAGVTGAIGATGLIGAIGFTGATGATGTTGVTGAFGPTGVTGSIGSTGVTGVAGSGAVFLSSSTSAAINTVLGGSAGNVAILPLSGAIGTAPTVTSASTYSNPTSWGSMQVLPKAITLTTLQLTLVNLNAQSLIGTTVSPTVRLFKVPAGSTTGSAIPGFSCIAAPPLTGIVAVGQLSSCGLVGASVSFSAGDAVFVEISEASTGLSLINSSNYAVSVSVAE